MATLTSEQIQHARAIAEKACPYPRNEPWQVGGMAAFLQWLVLYLYGGIVGLQSSFAAWSAVGLAAVVGLIFFLDTRQKEARHNQIYREAIDNIMWQANQ